ncbi:ATP-binding cassette domain-containing protein, partial [Escherichia coli]|uniref:ATP-binding cassette domain-containing protein n=1 Tax=Escherichia coli TaxID=562 RepID=UPI003D31D536
VIEFDHLNKAFGDRLLIEDLSFKLPPGGIVGVIGPNGAGKTTLLMAAIGLLASRGSMVFRGSDIRKMSVEDRVERRL